MHDIYNNKNVDTTKMKDKSVAKGMNEYGYEVYAANTKKKTSHIHVHFSLVLLAFSLVRFSYEVKPKRKKYDIFSLHKKTNPKLQEKIRQNVF